MRVTTDLQADFALDSPLSPWVLDVLPHLDPTSPAAALDVVSVVEATLEDPGVVLAAQLDRLRREVLAELKAQGVDYEQRLEVLDQLERPKPLRDWIYDRFNAYRARHPWAADFDIHPKSVARDLHERAMTFGEYVAHYGLARSEGLLLRYLSDVYKGLVRTVPEDGKTDDLVDLTEWLGEVVRQVDSSLIDEWRRMAEVAAGAVGAGGAVGARLAADAAAGAPPVTANRRAFRVMVRNAAFRRVELAARREPAALAASEAPGGWSRSEWATALDRYFDVHPSIGTGAEARSAAWLRIEEEPDRWRVRQVLDDPEGWHDAALVGSVELADSDAAGEPVWRTERVDVS